MKPININFIRSSGIVQDLEDNQRPFDIRNLWRLNGINSWDRVLVTFRFGGNGTRPVTSRIILAKPDVDSPWDQLLCTAYMVMDRMLYRKEMSQFKLPSVRGPFVLSSYINIQFYAHYRNEKGADMDHFFVNKFGAVLIPDLISKYWRSVERADSRLLPFKTVLDRHLE